MQVAALAAHRDLEVVAALVVHGRGMQRLVHVGYQVHEHLQGDQALGIGAMRVRQDQELSVDRSNHAAAIGAVACGDVRAAAGEIDEVRAPVGGTASAVGQAVATLVVGPEGTVERAWYEVTPDGHAAEVLKALGEP